MAEKLSGPSMSKSGPIAGVAAKSEIGTPQVMPGQVSLLSLPPEIITNIISQTDLPTALSLTLVCRSLSDLTEWRIWRDLQLYLPVEQRPGHDPPQITPFMVRQEVSEGPAAEKRYRAAMKKKMRKMILHGSARRMEHVRSVRMTPVPGSTPEMIMLLGYASARLEKLVIEGHVDYGPNSWQYHVPGHELFECRMIDEIGIINFPSLTHVRIINSPLRYGLYLRLLCNSAINLSFLDVDHDRRDEIIADEDSGFRFPDFVRETRLRSVRYNMYKDDDGHDDETALPFFELLRASPLLDQVSTSHITGDSPLDPDIMVQLYVMAELRDLSWPVYCEFFASMCKEATAQGIVVFPDLRRLVLNQTQVCPDFDITPFPLAHLEKLFYLYYEPPTNPSETSDPTRVFEMIPHLCRQIRDSPHLTEIYALDEADFPSAIDLDTLGKLEQRGQLTSSFSSFHHGGGELLFARLLQNKVEIVDLPDDSAEEDDDSSYDSIHSGRFEWMPYSAYDGTKRFKLFEFYDRRGGDPKWHTFAHFEGKAVPLDVMERMREVAGMSVEEWSGRGIEVGEAAWKVLMDWKASV